jgi:hypothetical protein
MGNAVALLSYKGQCETFAEPAFEGLVIGSGDPRAEVSATEQRFGAMDSEHQVDGGCARNRDRCFKAHANVLLDPDLILPGAGRVVQIQDRLSLDPFFSRELG